MDEEETTSHVPKSFHIQEEGVTQRVVNPRVPDQSLPLRMTPKERNV